MKTTDSLFDEHKVIHDLKHFLPAQAPLKDFIHHNTLHAFQNLKFHEALRNASEKFGYKAYLSLEEYRSLYHQKRIKHEVLRRVVAEHKAASEVQTWVDKLIKKDFENGHLPRIGSLRAHWKKQYQMDLDSQVHPILFRTLCSYLDQGISIWSFPIKEKTLIAAIREMERNSYTSFFKNARAKKLLLKSTCEIADLLHILVGDETLYEQYLFDQQFAHQGWSGMVSAIEDNPQALLDQRKASLHNLIVFELLLEIDALDSHFDTAWIPLAQKITERPTDLFAAVPETEIDEVLTLWHEAFEWSYYDEVLDGITANHVPMKAPAKKSFQAMFCIDDRECSLRRHLEHFDPHCETFGTPGFFGVEFFYQPENGKFYTKLCPAPVTPKYLIKEVGARKNQFRDLYLDKHSHSFYTGWLISQTLGFWSAVRLFFNIIRPTMSPATASSFKHMDKYAKLTIENRNPANVENDLQVGFTIEEMAIRVESLLKSIGLVKDFAPVVYIVGHGSSSVNNPHYAAYDCGACSGRAGSVNARVICYMANHPKVREILKAKGLAIPKETQFVGGLHDTTRDEIVFFDENSLSSSNLELHNKNEVIFANALDLNAKERARRFVSVNKHQDSDKVHEQIKLRSVSLFEPRPELNHATNALCIVGRRSLTKGVFLDRRSFLNSFDYRVDPEGNYLFNILKAAAPVCGGINLEYFFSRVDNQKLGAGTKLPHNVMGLFGVANGIDGDLRPGLPSQMIEIHDPVRLLMVVEHFPEVVLTTIQRSPETYEWFINDWVNLIVVHPETKEFYRFRDGEFVLYKPTEIPVDLVRDLEPIIETHSENLPVYLVD
ncbi:MAG: DUF2309 domain-containing protein [Spirosomataceae bacterium]